MPARICICDDEPVIGELLQRELSAAGYEVEEPLSSGEQAMGWLEVDPPDVLVLDLNMPVGGGLDLLGWMGGRGLLDHTRVLMLTGEADGFFISRARLLGASGYLVKPVAPGGVAAKVRRLLDDPDVRWVDDYTTVSRPAGPPAGASPAAQASGIARLNPTVAQMACTYGEAAVQALLQGLTRQLDRFPGGAGTSVELAASAHAVRGAAAGLGFEAVADACGELEQSCRTGAETTDALRRAEAACARARNDIAAASA